MLPLQSFKSEVFLQIQFSSSVLLQNCSTVNFHLPNTGILNTLWKTSVTVMDNFTADQFGSLLLNWSCIKTELKMQAEESAHRIML